VNDSRYSGFIRRQRFCGPLSSVAFVPGQTSDSGSSVFVAGHWLEISEECFQVSE